MTRRPTAPRLMPDTRQSEKSSDLCHLPMSLDQVVLYDAADQGRQKSSVVHLWMSALQNQAPINR